MKMPLFTPVAPGLFDAPAVTAPTIWQRIVLEQQAANRPDIIAALTALAHKQDREERNAKRAQH